MFSSKGMVFFICFQKICSLKNKSLRLLMLRGALGQRRRKWMEINTYIKVKLHLVKTKFRILLSDWGKWFKRDKLPVSLPIKDRAIYGLSSELCDYKTLVLGHIWNASEQGFPQLSMVIHSQVAHHRGSSREDRQKSSHFWNVRSTQNPVH